MKRKGLFTLFIACIFLYETTFVSFAGWEDNKDGDYTVTVYRDDATGQLITGWRELPWKDAGAWFYFGEDNILYEMRETPDGYIVDIDGAYYDPSKPFEWYNWGSEQTPKFVRENTEFNSSVGSMYFGSSVSKFFPDFSGEMTLSEFKQYMENKGAKVLTCSQTSRKEGRFLIGGKVYEPICYNTDFTFVYKGLKFKISTQIYDDKIGTGARIKVIGSAE